MRLCGRRQNNNSRDITISCVCSFFFFFFTVVTFGGFTVTARFVPVLFNVRHPWWLPPVGVCLYTRPPGIGEQSAAVLCECHVFSSSLSFSFFFFARRVQRTARVANRRNRPRTLFLYRYNSPFSRFVDGVRVRFFVNKLQNTAWRRGSTVEHPPPSGHVGFKSVTSHAIGNSRSSSPGQSYHAPSRSAVIQRSVCYYTLCKFQILLNLVL